MALGNHVYDKARARAAETGMGWTTADIKCVLCTVAYSADLANDDVIGTIPGGSILATSGVFTTKTNVAGTLGADNITLASVTGTGVSVVIYNSTTGKLIAYMDTGSGFPVVSAGGNVIIAWDAVNKIFTL